MRFPKMKIRMMWFFDLGLFPFSRFWMRAYWLLPIWVLMEINYGTGPRDGIGHWAHVGGFLFGGIAAVALRYSGLEHKVNKAIEEKVAWTPDPEISQAYDLMEHGKFDEAAATLKNYLTTKPDSFAGVEPIASDLLAGKQYSSLSGGDGQALRFTCAVERIRNSLAGL